jgi:heterotetrameric sarcosine oxidase gamma subunit
VLEFHSALESYRAQAGVDGADGRRALRLGEIAGTTLIQLGVYPGGAAPVAAGVLSVLSEGLPDSSVRAAVTGNRVTMRTAPDQYWLVGGATGLDARLRNAIPVDAGCVTSLDGARTRLFIEGQGARALLRRLVAIDLHPTIFPINGFAQTGIHHVGGLLLRVAEDRYEFFALRTYAASMWELLLDAAHSLGYETLLPETKT